ncbi:DeoR/GlpR family DNA-binding transcription regulator [Algirhabdus cladophorae]|uniref:DeoR/GlpR family DNA-binding transcription regulator n=1 Tax=Algirhabdus cladophorae TaxID=3377108 RepID=UPI003B84855E
MSTSARHTAILAEITRHGKATVDGLAAHFGVTVQTIRRDLGQLSATGAVERIHGGAVPASGVQNIGYDDRRVLNRRAKAAIALRVAKDIPNGSSLFINIGTTTESVATALLHHQDLLVVTNSLNVANILARNPKCEVIVAGGTLRRTDGGLVGELTSDFLTQFKVDIAVVGVSALDQDGDLLDFDPQEVRVSRAILKQARHSYLVADATKFTRQAPVRITSLAQIDALYTDAAVSEGLFQKCQDWKTQVHRVRFPN